jgi:hypothetical protein
LAKGTPVVVEFAYSIGGRLSVSARIPSTRHSATAVIDRPRTAQAQTLADWKKLIVGVDSPTDESNALIRRLDSILTRIGRAVAKNGTAVPGVNLGELAALRKTRSKLQAAVASLEQKQMAAGDRHIRNEIVSKLVQAATELKKTQARVDFGYLGAGRQVIVQGLRIPQMESELQEARRLVGILDRARR